ncbi:MAG: YbaB/EbfC family nucleoid-associated protein [Candidatus Omnitrophica bacterium]|nr:YbaB/EbfC family nucleoid-associated protein [Candidatus Omnitrophota bacterium]
MFDKMKQIMEMKKQADQIKRELDDIVVDVNEVPGINITLTGSQRFQEIAISDEMLKPENKDRLKKDLTRSVNAAIKKSQNVAAQKMAAFMPQM